MTTTTPITTTTLARALVAARFDIDKVLLALATFLTRIHCDGCVVALATESATAARRVTFHRADPAHRGLATLAATAAPIVHTFETADQARAALPRTYDAYIDRFGLRGLAILPLSSSTRVRGTVILTRDTGSPPFDEAALDEIEACIEYASLAAESALLLNAERMAVRAERERTASYQQDLLGIVGHDLRGPLGGILVGAEMLALERKDDPASTKTVSRIVSFTNRMTRMFDQLLDLTRARIGSGIPLARRPMRLVALLTAAITNVEHAFPSHTFALVGGDVEVTGLWDPERLGQVASYLLANAGRHAPDDTPITITVTHAEMATTLTIHNGLRGTPIPPDVLATMFEPARRVAGVGLDLYLVHEILRAHGGSIVVDSALTGTTFTVVLPDATPTA